MCYLALLDMIRMQMLERRVVGIWVCSTVTLHAKNTETYLFIYLYIWEGLKDCKKNTCIDFSVGIVLMREAVCCENTWHSS